MRRHLTLALVGLLFAGALVASTRRNTSRPPSVAAQYGTQLPVCSALRCDKTHCYPINEMPCQMAAAMRLGAYQICDARGCYLGGPLVGDAGVFTAQTSNSSIPNLTAASAYLLNPYVDGGLQINTSPDGGIAELDVRGPQIPGMPNFFAGNATTLSQDSSRGTYGITLLQSAVTSDSIVEHVGTWGEVEYISDAGSGSQFYYGGYFATQQGNHNAGNTYGNGGFYSGVAGVCENDSPSLMSTCTGVLGYANTDNGTITRMVGTVGEVQCGGSATCTTMYNLRSRNLANSGTVVGLCGAGISEVTGAANNVNLLIDPSDPPTVPDGSYNIYSTSARGSVIGGPPADAGVNFTFAGMVVLGSVYDYQGNQCFLLGQNGPDGGSPTTVFQLCANGIGLADVTGTLFDITNPAVNCEFNNASSAYQCTNFLTGGYVEALGGFISNAGGAAPLPIGATLGTDGGTLTCPGGGSCNFSANTTSAPAFNFETTATTGQNIFQIWNGTVTSGALEFYVNNVGQGVLTGSLQTGATGGVGVNTSGQITSSYTGNQYICASSGVPCAFLAGSTQPAALCGGGAPSFAACVESLPDGGATFNNSTIIPLTGTIENTTLTLSNFACMTLPQAVQLNNGVMTTGGTVGVGAGNFNILFYDNTANVKLMACQTACTAAAGTITPCTNWDGGAVSTTPIPAGHTVCWAGNVLCGTSDPLNSATAVMTR